MELEKLPLLVNSNFPVIAVESPLPERMAVLEYILRSCCLPSSLPCLVWNVGQGVIKEVRLTENDSGIRLVPFDGFKPQMDSRLEVLNFMLNYSSNAVFVLENIHVWLHGQSISWQLVSQVSNVYYEFLNAGTVTKRLMLLGQDVQLHPSLNEIVQFVENPLPEPQQRAETIQNYTKALKASIDSASAGKKKVVIKLTTTDLENLVRATGGLTLEEIRSFLRLIALEHWRFDSNSAALMNRLKAEKLRSHNIEFISSPDVVEFGGLDLLREELQRFSDLFSEEARVQGLPQPKGILLAGPPGVGKSLVAKITAKTWNIPMVPVDWGSLYGGIVGESESNLRNLIKRVEALAPAILYLDDFDKGFAGHGSTNDGGVSQRLANKMLTWLQEKTSPVFVMATVNRIDALPPELTREGRFNGIVFVDLPNPRERMAIFNLHLSKYKVTLSDSELARIAAATSDFSGSEIAAVVERAAGEAFRVHRQVSKLTVVDLGKQVDAVVPLARRDRASIKHMREWAARCAKPASSPYAADETISGHLSAPNFLLN